MRSDVDGLVKKLPAGISSEDVVEILHLLEGVGHYVRNCGEINDLDIEAGRFDLNLTSVVDAYCSSSDTYGFDPGYVVYGYYLSLRQGR